MSYIFTVSKYIYKFFAKIKKSRLKVFNCFPQNGYIIDFQKDYTYAFKIVKLSILFILTHLILIETNLKTCILKVKGNSKVNSGKIIQ